MISSRLLEAHEAGIPHRFEAPRCSIHSIADTVSNDHVAWESECRYVPFRLLQRSLNTRSEPLSFDYKLRNSLQEAAAKQLVDPPPFS